jgi:Pyruvate/2-oxoacid:ferredoxin oxidoreductase gamma subunit
MKKCIQDNVPKGTEEINLKAFDKGRELYREITGKA